MKKRIALSIVAALTGALLAAVPATAAQAVLQGYTYDGNINTADAASATIYGVAGAANTVTVKVISSATLTTYVTVSGGSALITPASSNSTVASNGLSATVAANGPDGYLVVATPVAGTITLTAYRETAQNSGLFSATAAETLTVSVAAAASSGVYSNTNSTAVMGAAGGNPAGAVDDVITFAAALPSAQAANILVTVKDSLNANLNGKTVSATIAGPGLLGIGAAQNTASSGRAVSSTANNTRYVTVWSDGTSGVATITISVGSTVLATKKVTFYGALATLKATSSATIYGADVTAAKNNGAGVADTYAVRLQGLDANGVEIPLTAGTVTVDSADETVIEDQAAQGVVSDDTGYTNQLLVGVDVDTTNAVAGKTAVVTYTIGTISTTATLKYGKTVASSVKVAFDKATYTPGEKATVTVTATDADGKAIADGITVLAGIVFSSNVTTDLSAATGSGVAGVKTYTVYMPLSSGPVTATATITGGAGAAAAIAGTTTTASATVAAPASAAETANAAAIAALQTNVGALQVTMASLVASITASIKSLNAAIAKIAKKLKIKL